MSTATMTPELAAEVEQTSALTGKSAEAIQKTAAAFVKNLRIKASASARKRYELDAQKVKA